MLTPNTLQFTYAISNEAETISPQIGEGDRQDPHNRRGLGQSLLTRGDCRLIRHAISEGWDVPERVRELVVDDVMAIVTDDFAQPRLQIAATWAIIEMVRDNQRDILMWGRVS